MTTPHLLNQTRVARNIKCIHLVQLKTIYDLLENLVGFKKNISVSYLKNENAIFLILSYAL